MSRYRYGAWHGGDDPLAPPYDVRAALDEVGADVLEGRGVAEALRDLLRRGRAPGRGLDDLAEQVRRRRQRLERSGRLGGVLDQVRDLLDRAVTAERQALGDVDGDDARLRESRLDLLPRETSRAVRDLEDYDWRSPEAAASYEEIRELLRREVIDQQFAGLREALQRNGSEGASTDPRLLDMLAALNALLARHARGEDVEDDFRSFMERYGDLFPEQPRDVDELVDLLARRQAAAERFLRSLSAEQRRELAQLVSDALADADLAAEMARLQDTLRDLRPGLDRTSRARFTGDQPLTYGQATEALAELSDLEQLEEQLGQSYPGATLDDVDVEAVERRLGERAGADVRAARELERELERQGWLARDRDGLRLTPKALRRLGATALRKVFAHLEGARGDHDQHSAGAAGDPTGSWRRWELGDEQPLDVARTVRNALLRTAATRAPAGAVTLDVEDFAVVETEHRARAAVALCVDLSWSMYAEGRWGAMKQTALALQHLVATRFPQDALEIVGFDRWARRLSALDLAGIEPQWVQGTNLQQALAVAGRHLRRHPDAEPVVLVVTDGEPTAHLEDDGEAFFQWPSSPETIRRTVQQVDLLTRQRATINTFVLGDDPGLARFVDALARRNGGRVLAAAPDRLGEYVVTDYLRARRGRRG